ncbi:hypothetical protein ACH5RR_003839 [Cinchona calisaya]|uniref:Uncharacterized protein n=1 Tax=Cinchona calisaya TaxID=153742 RepID=A0ABD3AW65_9GENT
MRKLCVMKLFSRRRAESWNSVRDKVDEMIRKVGSSNSSAVNLPDFFPRLKWLDPQGINKRLFEASASVDGFIDAIVDDHMEKKNNILNIIGSFDKVENDMVDELLEFYDDCGAKVFKESDDLHNSIRLTRGNIKVVIMAKMSVVINAWAIGRDEDAWEEVDTFKPSRFLKDGAPNFKWNDFKFILFRSGRRSGLAKQLGLFALEIAVAHLLHYLMWNLADG